MADFCLFDQYGKPVTANRNTLYRTPSQMGGDIRPRPLPRAKTYEAIQAWQRREMVDISRVIAAGVPNIDSALFFSGTFAIGDSWHMKSTGSNKAWGKKRDDWFNRTYSRNCNARGDVNDWRSTLRQLNWTRKVEADYGIWFDGRDRTQMGTDGKARFIEATGKFNIIKYDRISTGLIGGWKNIGIVGVGSGLDQVKELPRTWNYFSAVTAFGSWPGMYLINDRDSLFDGQRIIDGVIVDAQMVTLGYRLIGFNDDGMPTYADIPKDLIHFNYSAQKQVDLVRGIPEIAESIIPTMNLDDIQYLISMAVKLASALAITRSSTDGQPTGGRVHIEGDDFLNDNPPGQIEQYPDPKIHRPLRQVEEIYPGILELSTKNQEELKALAFQRPSMNEEAFVERVETSILHKLWPRALIYNAGSNRAGARSVVMQARQIINWDQQCTEKSARWIADRATEFAMRRGWIPMNDLLDDAYQYVFTVPGQFTVDEGTDLKMQLQSLGRCIISRGILCEMDGYLAEEIEEQREAEIDRLLSAAERIYDKHPKFALKDISLMLDNGGTNMSFVEQDREMVEEQVESKLNPAGQVPGNAAPAAGGNGGE